MKIRACLQFIFVAILILSIPSKLQSQEPQTIKVRRESNLAKVVFDNTENKLFVIDRFGNPKENPVLSYKLYVKNGKSTREFSGHSNYLTPEMLAYLNSQTSACKFFITEITVQDDHETVTRLPDYIDTWFPDCKNCTPTKKKRR